MNNEIKSSKSIQYRPFFFVLLLAVILRIALFTVFLPFPERVFDNPDAYEYHRIAINLLDRGVFSQEKQAPFVHNLRRTPFYPVLIAAVYAITGPLPIAVIVLQIALGTLTVALTILLTAELGWSKRTQWLAGLLLAIEPLSMLTGLLLLTETVFTTLLVATIWMLVRYMRDPSLKWILATACFAGLTALTRPIAQFLPILLLPFIFVSRRRPDQKLGAAISFILVSSFFIGGWTLVNYRQTGVFKLSSIGDVNLLYYRANAILAKQQGIPEGESQIALRKEMAKKIAAQGLNQAEALAFEQREAMAILLANPREAFYMQIKGLIRLAINPGIELTCETLHPHKDTDFCREKLPANLSLPQKILVSMQGLTPLPFLVVIITTVVLGLLWLGTFLGSIRLVMLRLWWQLTLLLGVVIYFLFISAGPEAFSRFRVPILPFLAILAAIGYVREQPSIVR